MLGPAQRVSPTWIGGILFFTLCFLFFHYKQLYLPSSHSTSAHGGQSSTGRKYESSLYEVPKGYNFEPIMNRTLGFQKAFALSMPYRSDKRDRLALIGAATDFDIDFRDGVVGSEVSDKALPPHWVKEDHKPSELGCWRGHTNIFQEIVHDRIESAIIFEDDASWDASLKKQMTAFAAGARWLGNETIKSHPHSPYGDNWDFLWLGACGYETREYDLRRFVMESGPAVPQPQRRFMVGGSPDVSFYPNDTRIVHTVKEAICLTGYAVSQRGARRILAGLQDTSIPIDLEMHRFCRDEGLQCVGAYPVLVGSHAPMGPVSKGSDINEGKAEDFRNEAATQNIVFDVSLNLDKILKGDPDLDSQWPEDLELYNS